MINVVQPKCSRKNIRDQFHTGKAHVKQYVINVMQPKNSRQKIRDQFYADKAHVKIRDQCHAAKKLTSGLFFV